MDDDQITTVDDLAAALQASEGQADKAPDAAQGDAANQGEANPPAETPQDAAPAEGADDAAADDAGQAAQAPADDAVIRWKAADGSDIEATVSELKAGHLRHADYTQKTQQLAEERKQAAAQIAQQFQQAQEFAKEQAQLMNIQERLNLFAKADWNDLYQQDAAEAGRLQAQWMQLQEQGRAMSQSYQAKLQQREAERAQQFRRASQEALQTLQRDIPGFGAEQLKAMREAGAAHGFSDEELAQVADARTLKVLHEAAQWRALQAQKSVVQKKVQAAPPKATKPGATGVPPSKSEAAWKQLNARRDVDSLAAFLAASE